MIDACTWNAPGADPYRGDVLAAVEVYADIPAATRVKLRERMERRQYDDVAAITRDGIAGEREYTGLRQMHFGAGRVCETVDRSGWSDRMVERGLVYCEDEHCIIVPTVCRNVSRVDQRPLPPEPVITAPLPVEPGGTVNGAPFAALAAPGGSDSSLAVGWGPRLVVFPGRHWGGRYCCEHVPTAPVPEPATYALWLIGLAVAWRFRHTASVANN